MGMNEQVIEITDAQVLAQLKMRRVRLKIELERVELGIKAFEDVKEVEELDALPYIVESDEIIDDEQLGIAKLMYNPRMSREKKILYVLSKIGQGDVHAIASYLIRIDSNTHPSDTRQVYDRVTWVASRMYKLGKIDAFKDGKKNVYKLLDK
jgi:hypothetical protein